MIKTVLNLTQHDATQAQRAVGIVDLPFVERERARTLLTFDTLPTKAEVRDRAQRLAALVRSCEVDTDTVMIGGALFLMTPLQEALSAYGYTTVFAFFSQRETLEERQPDGSVRKTTVFRHLGFVPG
jgi:hypothetical protein